MQMHRIYFTVFVTIYLFVYLKTNMNYDYNAALFIFCYIAVLLRPSVHCNTK
jgi:hypothetical protein